MKQPDLILVRHGETVGESSIRYHGRTDVMLSELGRSQMRAARAAIDRVHGGLEFSHIFSSPLSRAAEGARIIAGERTPIITIDEFSEVDFGLFEGLTAEEIRERHPKEFTRWETDRLSPSYQYPGGESRAAFAMRVQRGVERMLAMWSPEASNTRALVIVHRGVIRMIGDQLIGKRPDAELGSIHILRLAKRWQPVALDLISHLDAK
ncbi:MAG TPA: histidine phosphatase family protein [Candidatus Binataceae bacterium]|nr:histidine phosphatase family protein [Candidatus Binataceae bacterium]